MAYTLTKYTTKDQPFEMTCRGTAIVDMQIFNAEVAIAFGTGEHAPIYENDEHYAPMVMSFTRRCDAIRVRSFIPGTPAVITILCRSKSEI